MSQLRHITLLILLTALITTSPVMAEGRQDDAAAGDQPAQRERTRAAAERDKAQADTDDEEEESRRGSRRRPQLSPEQMDEAVAVLKAMRPELAERISLAMDENPERVHEMVLREYPRLRFMISLKQRDPRMFHLRAEDIRLAYETQQLAENIHKLREAGNVPRLEAAKDRLEQLLEEHYDVRHRLRQLEIARLEQRLEQLREELEQRAARRDALIRQRREELLKDD